MSPHTRSAAAALSLSAALAAAVAACTSAGEPMAPAASTVAPAERVAEAPPRIGSASAALQTGVSTAAIVRAPQRPAPVPPPPATGPSLAAAHAAVPAPAGPFIPQPEPEAAPAPASAQSAEAAARPSTPAPAPASAPVGEAAGLSTAELADGRRLFNAFSCGACHVLADAGGTGHVGPALDGNAALTRDYVIDIVTNGRGAMPGFGGQLTDEQIALLAAYILQVRK